MPLLSHPNEEVVYKVLALLKALLECGNKTVRDNGLASLISAKEHTLFPTLQRMLKQSAVAYGERYVAIYLGMHSCNGFKSYTSFSQFLIARMKDQIITDRQLVRPCTCIYDCYKLNVICLNYVVRACHGNHQQTKNS